MKVFSTNKTAVIIAAILAVSTNQTTARLLEKENSVEGSDVDILEPLYPEERDLGIFEGGTEDSMRAARMEDLDMRAARMDDETLYRAAEMDKSLYDAGRIDGGTEAARLDGGDYDMRAPEMRAEEMRAPEMRAEDMARMDMRAEEDIDMARMARARDMGNRDMQENPYGVPLP